MNRIDRTLRNAIVLTFAATTLAAPGFAADKGDKGVAVKVNGKAIPQSRLDAVVALQAAQGQPDSPEARNAVKEFLVRREVVTQESIKNGFEKKNEVQAQLEMARQEVLINAYLGDYVQKNPVTDAQIKKEYDSIKARMGDKEYKVRHVLLEKEDEAKAVIASLKKGDKFDELAKQSKDPGSKDKGGDLGWANLASFVPTFSEAMSKLEKGKFTETPVKSDFGWHVIQLDDTRELKLPTLDEAKGQIGMQLQQRMVQQHIEELRKKAKVQ